jgi:hypothetical protein
MEKMVTKETTENTNNTSLFFPISPENSTIRYSLAQSKFANWLFI